MRVQAHLLWRDRVTRASRRPAATRPSPQRRSVLGAAISLILAAAAPAAAQARPSVAGDGSLSDTAGAGRATPTLTAHAALRPGDALRVRIWRESDLSGEFTIDSDGRVNLPKLGQVAVAGLPLDHLKAQLAEAYGEYVTVPVEITPLLRISVAGAVRTPGLYRVDPTMSMADALALAGGVTPDGRTDRVRLVRAGSAVAAALSMDATLAATPLRSGDQLLVPGRRWWQRDPQMIIGAVSAVATLVWALQRFRDE